MNHSRLVRITHWTTALSFAGLLVSGIAILLSHPRLYWGETGNMATPSLLDLPLPFVLAGQNGWGRYLHFLSGWVLIIAGIVYVGSGVVTGHFREHLLPLGGSALPGDEERRNYNLLQRAMYLAVIFAIFPLAIWTGLAMSPALVSVVPAMVTVFGGHQSARTLHFFAATVLVLFVVIHVIMVWVAGFRVRIRAMVTGYSLDRKEHA